ncbi:MAG: hypothetical protein CMF49_06125 [Legionellales bacterium]|nr:hypothetical protein [Legionellales bacterium]|tara:strand:- start:224 stop:424 length:201 start_codon:yes stop_codon:yes gene_type:complete
MHKQFIYHPELGDMLIDAIDAEHFFKKGWFDTPAKFPKNETVKVTENKVKKSKSKKAELDGANTSN